MAEMAINWGLLAVPWLSANKAIRSLFAATLTRSAQNRFVVLWKNRLAARGTSINSHAHLLNTHDLMNAERVQS